MFDTIHELYQTHVNRNFIYNIIIYIIIIIIINLEIDLLYIQTLIIRSN